MGVAVPVSVGAAMGADSKCGVVVKTGAAFERFGGMRHLAVDKTGPLTRNEHTVTRVVTTGATKDDVLAWAASLEGHSTHHLAASRTTNAVPGAPAATDVRHPEGYRIFGSSDGARLSLGRPRWPYAGTPAAEVKAW